MLNTWLLMKLITQAHDPLLPTPPLKKEKVNTQINTNSTVTKTLEIFIK